MGDTPNAFCRTPSFPQDGNHYPLVRSLRESRRTISAYLSRRSGLLAAAVLAVALLLAPAASAAGSPVFKLGVVLDSPDSLGGFEADAGRRADIFLWYQSIDEDFDGATLAGLASGGRIIQLSWEPIPGNKAINPADYQLKKFARGDFDTDLRRWAREMRDFGYPVIIRPMCEMNGNWTLWSGVTNGNTPADYIAAWRHMHDVFIAEGARNVAWDWSPNRDGSTADAVNTFNNYYPGDAYVDYVGFSGYNWGTMYNSSAWVSSWQSFEEVFGYSYDVMAARTNKPIMLSESASTELGGDKAAWITDAFDQLPVRFPRVVSLTWFNLIKETDWRIESSAASQQAFSAGIRKLDLNSGLCGMPEMQLNRKASFWANYYDYVNRVLSVDFNLDNTGSNDAFNIVVDGSSSSGGVSLASGLPVTVGDVAAGGESLLRMKYAVPGGGGSFFTSTFATAEDRCGLIYRYSRTSSWN